MPVSHRYEYGVIKTKKQIYNGEIKINGKFTVKRDQQVRVRSRYSAQKTQYRTPGSARRRTAGITSPQPVQYSALSP
jgi:hypothetical protein